MKECPFCLTPIGEEVVVCPKCSHRVDAYRTGYYARPDLPRTKAAAIWIAAIAVLALLAFGITRACGVRRTTVNSSGFASPGASAPRRAA